MHDHFAPIHISDVVCTEDNHTDTTVQWSFLHGFFLAYNGLQTKVREQCKAIREQLALAFSCCPIHWHFEVTQRQSQKQPFVADVLQAIQNLTTGKYLHSNAIGILSYSLHTSKPQILWIALILIPLKSQSGSRDVVSRSLKILVSQVETPAARGTEKIKTELNAQTESPIRPVFSVIESSAFSKYYMSACNQ